MKGKKMRITIDRTMKAEDRRNRVKKIRAMNRVLLNFGEHEANLTSPACCERISKKLLKTLRKLKHD